MVRLTKEWRLGLSIALSIPLVLVFRHSVMELSRITSASMEPTIKKGQLVLNRRIGTSTISRGDIVFFKSKNLNQRGRYGLFIKRIIGLSGETIEVVDGSVYINGILLSEPYLATTGSATANVGPYMIPDESFFVLGDNRSASYDSRYWGEVQSDEIVGKALLFRGHNHD